VFRHGYQRRRFEPNVDYGAAAGGLATTIAADGPINTATLPTAVTFSSADNN
jgi:hypothetical protein